MGLKEFFRNLFSGSGAEDNEEELEDELEESYSAYPNFYKGALMDVMSEDGKVDFSGRLTEFAARELIIDRIPGDMSFPLLGVGQKVRIRGYNQVWEPYNLTATVLESSKVVCRVGNMEVVPYRNIRKDCRQPVRVPAALYHVEDTRFNNPIECKVQDISLGGACVISEYLYDKGDTVRLRVELIEKGGHESFISQVIRVTPREDGTFEYGLLFAQMNQRQTTSLRRDIVDIQRELQRRLQE